MLRDVTASVTDSFMHQWVKNGGCFGSRLKYDIYQKVDITKEENWQRSCGDNFPTLEIKFSLLTVIQVCTTHCSIGDCLLIGNPVLKTLQNAKNLFLSVKKFNEGVK